ncbi:MAG: hypothetical protein JSU65_00700 [Candidatus Zixiibacteriota bacterium]|nr:MAG: hypothetical protein JSU65_00700 [candidate division Zixibacteria bacterium]
MKTPVYMICLTLFTIVTASADSFVRPADEIQLPLPDDWSVVSDSSDYPFQLARFEPAAELLVFKSTIEASDAIRNEEDLKASVDMVIEDVILQLPEAKLLTSTGFLDINRAVFVIEFTARDSASDITLRHRFNGLIYRTSDGRQQLFTLWAKTALSDYPAVSAEIGLIQEGFNFITPTEQVVFGASRATHWYAVPLVILLVCMLYLVRKRTSARARTPFRDNRYFWRCQCGRTNHVDQQSCRRCGRPGPSPPTEAQTDNARMDGADAEDQDSLLRN